MIRMKLRACPWCGWRSVTLVVYDGSPKLYSIRCNHCGYASRKSRFKWRTKWFWNNKNHVPAQLKKKRRYHIYGNEF